MTSDTNRRVAAALIAAGIADEVNNRQGTITDNSLTVLQRRYLAKDPDGTVTEDAPGMFRRVALNLSQADLLYGADEAQRQETEDAFYDAISSLDLLPNSPTLMNAGRELQQLSACFVLPVPDSLEDIFDAVKYTAIIHKSGGGTGFAFSRLRPEGAKVGSTGGVASGPVSFIRAFDTGTDVVKQGGTRRGANMGILDVTHPDILKFIHSKDKGDQLLNFNISVAVSDEFMLKALAREEYELQDPRDGSVTGTLNAGEVFDQLVASAWTTGDPGLVFMDAINRENPNPQLGRIESTNPCFAGHTVIKTTQGDRTAHQLVGTPFTALINGEEWESAPEGFFLTGTRHTVTLQTAEGWTLTVTPTHQVRVRTQDGDSWQEAASLLPGDLLVMHSHTPVTDGGRTRHTYRQLATITAEPITRTSATRTDHCPAATITLVGYNKPEEVYDVQIPGINAVDANGFYAAQCGEQPLAPYESCNLASINLGRMTTITPEGTTLERDRLSRTIAVAVHMLDNVIDMNSYPLPQVDETTKLTRRIGLGVMGLADLLVQMGLRYDSQEALKFTGELMALIQQETHAHSHKLALARGPFPAWEHSAYGPNRAADSRQMRNSAPTTVAPTGTISIIAGASSGIEPFFALAFERNVMDNTRLVESNPYLEAIARHEGFYSEELMAHVARTGTVDHPQVPTWVKNLFRTAPEITPEWHVRMQAAVQERVDNAVSKTINFPKEATQDDIRTAYTLAFNLNCKGITVYRDGSHEDQVLSTGTATAKNGHVQAPEPPSNSYVLLTPRERPRNMTGVTERLRTGHGNMYITVNHDDDGVPFEVFGNLGKAGGCDSAQLEAITRLTTLCLRSGINPDEIVAQLSGITCCPAPDDGVFIKSSPDALALALHRATHQGENPPSHAIQPALLAATPANAASAPPRPSGPACPDCSSLVMISEGCQTCTSPACGWSKCL